MCDGAGCQFSDAGSYFAAQVPLGFTTSWTIGLWVREVFSSKAGVISVMRVRRLLRIEFSLSGLDRMATAS